MMCKKMLCATLFVIALSSIVSSHTFCEDWTICQRVRCAAPPDSCPKDKPYLLYSECGCCQFCSLVILLVIAVLVNGQLTCEPDICQRIDCINRESCDLGQYLVWDNCGCCQYCSETPRIGPCGECGKDVVCKESYPICPEGNYTVSLDYCGCCRVCKSIIEIGGHCDDFSVCAAGLECNDGTCQARPEIE